MKSKRIFLAKDTIEKYELFALCDWIKADNKLTKGPLTIEFERKFADYLDVKHSVFVNSGSSANLLMIYSLLKSNILKNKKVIAPAVSWVTTISPLMQLGLDIKLCDCDKDDLGLDVAHFEKLCKEHNPAFAIIVHVLGHVNNMDPIIQICKKYDVLLLEDSCEALGSIYNDKKLGSISTMGSFSFYYGHHISTIEGGMVVTDNTDLYNLMLSIRSHGWGRDVNIDYHEQWKKGYDIDEVRDLYTFYYPGFNLRSSDLNAFLGISQLKKVDQLALKRQENFYLYKSHLEEFWCQKSKTDLLSNFAYGVIVKNRLEVYRHLKENGIETRPLICGSIGRHPFWIKRYGELCLRNADIIHDNGLYLPNHNKIGKLEIKYISEKFTEVAEPLLF
jgi:CDP-6-deoxy-D-xylo-4-hexulose-3-dehydrase